MGTRKVPGRGVLVGLILTLGVGGICGWALAVGARGVVLDGMDQPDPILLGAQNEISVRLRNANLWRSLEVGAVGTSCGCLTVRDAPDRIGAGSIATVSLTAAPSPLLPRRSELVDVELAKGEILRIPLEIEPLAPFDGWPTHAVVQGAGPELTLDLAPEYTGVVTSAYTVIAEGALQPVIVEGATLRLLVAHESLMPRELVITFGPGSPNWSGPLILADHSEVEESP